jgi:hypothetical protein
MHSGWRNRRGTGTSSAVNAATNTRAGRSIEATRTATDSRDHADAEPSGASRSTADQSCCAPGSDSDANTHAVTFDW